MAAPGRRRTARGGRQRLGDHHRVPTRSTPRAPIGDAFIAAALMVSIAAVLNFPSVRRRGVDLLVMSLDGLIMGAAVLIIASVLVYSELLDTSSDAGRRPVHGRCSSRCSTSCWRRWPCCWSSAAAAPTGRPSALVASGFIMYAIADLAFAVQVAQETFEFGTPLDLGWIAGYLLIAPGGVVPLRGDRRRRPPHTQSVSEARDTMIVFSVLLVAAFVQVGVRDAGAAAGRAGRAVDWC